jgi:hypothetical protein
MIVIAPRASGRESLARRSSDDQRYTRQLQSSIDCGLSDMCAKISAVRLNGTVPVIVGRSDFKAFASKAESHSASAAKEISDP